MTTGYVDCACRDCFEIAIGESGEAMCHGCEEAGCEKGEECQSPDAYETEPEREAARAEYLRDTLADR